MREINHGQLKLTVLVKPTRDDIEILKQRCNFHPLVMAELAKPTFYPKIEHYQDHTLLIFRFPQFNEEIHEIKASEIDIILTDKEMVLVQYNHFQALDNLLKDLELSPTLRGEYFESTPAMLMYKVLEHLFSSLFKEVEHIGQTVEDLEDQIFIKARAEQLVSEISILRREAIDFKRIIAPNLKILQELHEKPAEFFDKKFAPYLHKLYSINSRLLNLVEAQLETLHVLHETNEALLSHKLSYVMKILTMFSVIVFPLTLFASIWGMNVEHMPLVGHPFDFWLLLIMMGLGTLGMLIAFKLKKWI